MMKTRERRRESLKMVCAMPNVPRAALLTALLKRSRKG